MPKLSKERRRTELTKPYTKEKTKTDLWLDEIKKILTTYKTNLELHKNNSSPLVKILYQTDSELIFVSDILENITNYENQSNETLKRRTVISMNLRLTKEDPAKPVNRPQLPNPPKDICDESQIVTSLSSLSISPLLRDSKVSQP